MQARLRFSNEINEEDIRECEDIMQESQKNVSYDGEPDRKEIKDDVSQIFGIIKEMGDYKTNKPIIDMSILLKRVVSKGYSEDALKKTI